MTQVNSFLMVSRDVLEQGKSVRFQARGWSMRPLIRNGDIVTACSVKKASVKIGDIVFYIADNNRAMVHRIIGLRGNRNRGDMTAWIKGDACFGPTDKVPVQNIVGRVVVIERKGREKRLDTVWHKALSLVLVGVSPLTIWVLPILIAAKKTLWLAGGKS